MPAPITDGLTLLRTLRDSGTPRATLDCALEVVSSDPHAPAELVLKALQDGGAKAGTLAKAMQLMQTGEVRASESYVDPLDVLAAQRGDVVEVAAPASAADLVNPEVAALKAELAAERQARLDAEGMLELATGPAGPGDGGPSDDEQI